MFVSTQLVQYQELLILKNAKYIFRVEGDNNKAKYGVTLGIYNRCVKEPTRRTFAVTKVVINPNFTSPTGNYDIAIITLNQTTDYTPICLPEEGNGQCATRLCIYCGVYIFFQKCLSNFFNALKKEGVDEFIRPKTGITDRLL